MAPRRSMVSISRVQRRNNFQVFGQLPGSCLLLLLAAFVGVAAAACSDDVSRFGDLEFEESTGSRRLLAVKGVARSLRDDAELLLEIKRMITADPENATVWWKPQGRNRALNPCKMVNATKQYWPGIDCTYFGKERRVTAIDISGKHLAGALSPALGQLSRLKYFNASNNLFTGAIPVQLPAGLETLDLANNQLQLTVPASIGGLQNLTSLNVANNRVTGAIPASIGKLLLLSTLNMSGNNLTETIPAELNLCSRLAVVDLSRNRIRGAIPFQGLENLTTLHLQDNRLQGNLTAAWSTFPRLRDLDLSNNELNDTLPTTVSPTALQRIALSGNRLTGSLPGAIGRLSSLRELDVSRNGLSGVLPTTLASLVSLTTFNASHNVFSGRLPSLAGAANLRIFDASFNNLMGAVLKDFVNHTSLTYLNVSYNNLSGAVPPFDERDGVNRSSFLENVALCGKNIGLRDCPLSSTDSATAKIVSISVGSSIAFVAMVIVVYICCRRNGKGKARSSASVSAELDVKLTPEEVRRATQNFLSSNYIGAGSMSTVYRGVLPDTTVVAVKRLGVFSGEINAAEEKVLDDGLQTLAQVREWTLVKVVGYCWTPEVKAIVMEHMPNGPLTNLLYPPRDAELVREFSWSHRFDAAIAVAQGLKYLHHERRESIVHGDLKPSNILFSAFMEARIADFGVKALLESRGVGVGASLTSGYTAPELSHSQSGTIKGDVYSFGIIVLELISGRSPQSLEPGQRLPQWIRATISNSKSLHNVLDPILMGELRVQQQRMAMVVGVALLCTREDPQERPYITEVLKMLNHIKTRPQDGSRRGSRRLRPSASTHQRNREIREQVPEIELSPSPPLTPSLPANPSLSHWTPENR